MTDALEMKLAKLVENLHEATLTGQVKWEKTAYSGRYQTSFPNLTVTISEIEPDEPFEGTIYAIRVYNKKNTLIEEIYNSTIDKFITTKGSAWNLMRDIFIAARRAAENVENAIDQILDQLRQSQDQE